MAGCVTGERQLAQLTEIEDNDGDARAHMHVVRALRQRLTHIALQP